MFVYYLVLAQEIPMYLRSFQMCLSTDSLMIKESLSCRNASPSYEFDTYLRNSIPLLSYITLQSQRRSFASSYSKARLESLTNKTVFINTPRTALQLTSFCSGHTQSSAIAMQFQKLREH